jgi:hypothetical protein
VERSENFLLPCYSCPIEKFIKIAACMSCLLSEKAILSLIVLLLNSYLLYCSCNFVSREGLDYLGSRIRGLKVCYLVLSTDSLP